MPIAQDQVGTARYPVVRRAAIGEKFIGAYITHKSRPILKDGKEVINQSTGKPRHEMIVHALVMPGNTATVGNAEDFHTPEPGDVVRLILKGKSFGQWIDGLNAMKGVERAGDIIEQTIDRAQTYDSNGAPKGAEILTQEEANKVPRGVTLGFYGAITLRAATAAEMEWVTKADAAHAVVGAGRTVDAGTDDESPF